MEKNLNAAESELVQKLDRIHAMLDRNGLDALLLRRSDNFAWATGGASSHINTADSFGNSSLLISPSRRVVLTDNIEAPRLMQEEGLAARGWEIQVTPWYEGKDRLANLSRDLSLGADADLPGAINLSGEIAALRSELSREEGERFRTLARLCAQGMEQAARAVRPGMTEYEIAGQLSRAVESSGVQAIVNLVATDERIFAFRHPLPTSKRLDKYAMLILCGRKWGLICSVTRLVHFGPLPGELRRKAEAVARIDAAMIAATRPGSTLGDVFRKTQAAYAEAGFPDEWRNHHQGGSAGYAPREVTATPASGHVILAGQAFAWNPSITGTKSEDTILIGQDANEILTAMPDWPGIDVRIDGQIIRRPATLEKDS